MPRQPDDFNAEIRAHIELEAARYEEQGMSREQALSTARRAFGNATAAEERFHDRTAGYGSRTSSKTYASPFACSRRLLAGPLSPH